MGWYEDNIEEPVRPLVRALRDNGFNTTSSCGHEMEVEVSMTADGEMKRLHDLLFNGGYRAYDVEWRHEVRDGRTWRSWVRVIINPSS